MNTQDLPEHEADELRGKPLFQLIQDVMPYRKGVRSFNQIEKSEWMRLLGRLSRRHSQETLTTLIRKGYREGFFQKGVYPERFAQYVSKQTPAASRSDPRTMREWAWRRAVDLCAGEARGIGIYREEFIFDQIRHCSGALQEALVDENLDEDAAEIARRKVRPRIDAVLIEHFGEERIERWRIWCEEQRRAGEAFHQRYLEYRRRKERAAEAANAPNPTSPNSEVVADVSEAESLMSAIFTGHAS